MPAIHNRPFNFICLDQWFSTFFGPWTIFKKISDGALCYADTSWTTSQSCIALKSVTSRARLQFLGTFMKDFSNSICRPLEILGGPQVVHPDQVENHWFRPLSKCQTACSQVPCGNGSGSQPFQSYGTLQKWWIICETKWRTQASSRSHDRL